MTETRQRRLWWRHLISVLIAPVTMTLVIPALIAISTGVRPPHLTAPLTAVLALLGVLLIAGGLALLIWTVILFDRVGKGTLGVGAVLGEPVNLVVHGPYRHVRNPMISGVLFILLGEAAVTASWWLLLWFAVFFTVLDTNIRLWEEPHLAPTVRGRIRQLPPTRPARAGSLEFDILPTAEAGGFQPVHAAVAAVGG